MEMWEESFPVRSQDCCLISCRQLTRAGGGGFLGLHPAESPPPSLVPPTRQSHPRQARGTHQASPPTDSRFLFPTTPPIGCLPIPHKFTCAYLPPATLRTPLKSPSMPPLTSPGLLGLPSSNPRLQVSTLLLRVVRGPAASASRGRVLEMQTLQAWPKPAESASAFSQDCQGTHWQGS